jgi:hypothetical protein
MLKSSGIILLTFLLAIPCMAQEQLSKEDTLLFMRKLATFVAEKHMRTSRETMQHGMTYEYRDMRKEKAPACFVQGEALDTMHDGAWFGAAMVNASLATGDPIYRDLLEKNVLPFYCRVLNHSDKIFSNKTNHARPASQQIWAQQKEWLFQEGEKGFVPYWWDDGGSVSLERLRDKNQLPAFPSFDQFVSDKKPNPEFILSGFSLGSSNHLAQDLGVLLQLSWLYYRELKGNDCDCFRSELSDAAQNLQASRMRHHGHIPMCDAPAALVLSDPAFMRLVPDASVLNLALLNNHYKQALQAAIPDRKYPTPAFADDQQYKYYAAIARHGKLPQAAAFKLVYDAYTEPKLYHYYSDDASVAAGMNRFDLHPINFIGGRPADYRSDKKGPGGKPRPMGSRFGPQNMIQCALALQAFKQFPDLWDGAIESFYKDVARVNIHDPLINKDQKSLPTTIRLGKHVVLFEATHSSVGFKTTLPNNIRKITITQVLDSKRVGCDLIIKDDGMLEARNFAGVLLGGKYSATLDGGNRIIDCVIPTTVVKAQSPWMNSIELEKYSIKIDGDEAEFILASRQADVVKSLELEVAGGIFNWSRIFATKGFIPTGIETGADWDHYSDTGGYAHLISACAQYLNYLEGKKDWEVLRIPTLIESNK